jgi:hypothetical protein
MTSPLSPPQTGGRRGESTRSARFIASARSENVISRLPALKTHPPIDPSPTETPRLFSSRRALKAWRRKKKLGEGAFRPAGDTSLSS